MEFSFSEGGVSSSRLSFEVLIAMTMRIAVLKDVRPCNLVDTYWHFGETLQS
jgi:hypothetical protein